MTDIIHPGNLDCFISVYREKLQECVITMPEQYGYSASDADIEKVVQKMKIAFANDTYNITNSPAIKRTCKALKINYTRKAIKAFISG